jgi:hypothetical protein
MRGTVNQLDVFNPFVSCPDSCDAAAGQEADAELFPQTAKLLNDGVKPARDVPGAESMFEIGYQHERRGNSGRR